MSEFMDRARAEAEREVARRNWSAFKNEGEYLSSAWCQGFEKGFTEGAAWADVRGPSVLPEKFRDPVALARFVIENEWALDSEADPNVRADWNETLDRVCDAWDSETPDDIVSAIAAAVRLDRSFRAAEQEPTDEECAALVESLDWAIRGTTDGDKIDPCSEIPVVEVMRLIEEGAQSAILAAQKVRVGQ